MTPLGKYIWLINVLQKSAYGLTFEEINELWIKNRRNSEDANIPILKRTFHNHIKAIREEYSIHIVCGRGYRYYIADAENEVISKVNLLSTLNALTETFSDNRLNKNVFVGEYFDMFREKSVMAVMEAIKNRRKVRFAKFKRVNKPDKYQVLHIAPYQLHYICSQWYVLGHTDEFGLMRIPLDYYKRGGSRNIDDPYNYPGDYSEAVYYKKFYGPGNDSIRLTVKIKCYDSQEYNFQNYPLSPFQQSVECRERLEGERAIDFIMNNYVKIFLEMPKTPFALYALKSRLEKYRYELLTDADPFTLFSEEEYNDAMNNPTLLK